MREQLIEILQQLLLSIARGIGPLVRMIGSAIYRLRVALIAVGVVSAIAHALYRHPPMETIAHGELGVRNNLLSGSADLFSEGTVLVLPGIHELRRYSLRDRIYHPAESAAANGSAAFQSIEGLSLGIDLSVRYALDPKRILAMASQLPDDIDGEVVQPVVQNVIYKVFTRYTVKEIYSSKRGEIQQLIESELETRLAADGIVLRAVQIGKVDLPGDYRAGMEKLLAEELETEKMRYTLQLKDQQVKQSELEAEAEKVRREKAAEAAGNEQIIAARAQEEAMKHVLPFKQKQIEQRQLEAEADKVARIKGAEANAQARRIEAQGEADSREKLADADAYRLDQIGKITSAQMERDGAALSRHPLLIQKTMADKLSDKVSVIIAPPSTTGGFIGSALLGQAQANAAAVAAAPGPSATTADTGAENQ
jgi:regulator of protease activity HflC (stomatin/prohibitin superfamily)